MRSKFETNVGKLLSKSKIEFEYEPHTVSYIIEGKYTPDFKIGNMYIETKGFFKPADRRKMLAVKKANPDMDIRMWFMYDNYITKSKKSKYSDWAKKHDFPCHVGLTFPNKWIKR